jgi:hypothetical protein
MITVKQVKDLGVAFVGKDIIAWSNCRHPRSAGECAKLEMVFTINMSTNLGFMHPNWTIREFAPRKNEGVQPVKDDVLVDVTFKGGEQEKGLLAGILGWAFHDNLGDIITWTPSMKNWEDMEEIKEGLTCSEASSFPKLGQKVYIAQINTLAGLSDQRYYVEEYWCDSKFQREYLELGILFENKDSAILKTNSILAIPAESPEQKEAREQLELVDDACEMLFGKPAKRCNLDIAATVEAMIAAGYRVK